MKRITTICLLFFCVQMLAQSVILLEQDSVFLINENADISDPNKYFSIDLFFKNNTSENISVHWKREFNDNCPSEWIISTSDQILDYVPHIDESVIPIQMTPVDSHFIIKHSIQPQQLAGCCDGKVIFYLESDSENPIDTGYFHIEINSSNCSVTTTTAPEKLMIDVFPNPVNNTLYIDGLEDITEHKIYNSNGSLIMDGGVLDNDQIDTSPLPEGIYYLHLSSDSGRSAIKKIMKAGLD